MKPNPHQLSETERESVQGCRHLLQVLDYLGSYIRNILGLLTILSQIRCLLFYLLPNVSLQQVEQ